MHGTDYAAPSVSPKIGATSAAQSKAFEDTWTWGYNVGGLHLPTVILHVAMPMGSVPAVKGDPGTGVSAPLTGLMLKAETLAEYWFVA